MSPTLKRVLLIFALLAVTALIGFGLYYVFWKKPAQITVITPTAPGEGGQLPTAGERGEIPAGGEEAGAGVGLPSAGTVPGVQLPSYYQPTPVEQLTTYAAAFPSLGAKGDLRYYNAGDGKFYRIMPDGSIKELSDQNFYNVQNVTWAKSQNKAVMEYPDGSNTIYNFDTRKQVTLPKHWENFSFSADGSEVAAKSIGLAPENRWIVTVNDDGSGTKLIEPMGENADKVKIDWSPSRQTVAFSQTGEPLGADRREVLLIGLHGENFKSAVVEGLDFVPQWSPTGKRLLYSVDSARSDYKPELWITDAYGDEIGNNRQMLKLNTWANKCAFSDDTTLYCAVPRDLPAGAGMSPEVAAGSYDDMYKIDLKTGLQTQIPLGDKNYNVANISFDKTGNKIMFTDSNQRGVFEAKL